MELKFTVSVKIQRPRSEVFDAVHNPKKLSRYFTTGSASAPLDAGTTVIWRFHDYPGDIPVHVKEVVPNERIVLAWQAADGDYETRVEMKFETLDAKTTLMTISESGWKENEKALKASYDNCHGWTQMSCCLKAWLEHGINLREEYY